MNITKNNLSIAERIMFVDSVNTMSKNDGRYEPALYDYAFRINLVIFFTDSETKNVDQTVLTDLAYSDEINKLMQSDTHRYIIDGLNKACREKISIEREEWFAVYNNVMKNKPFDDLVNIVEKFVNEISKELDMKNLVKVIAEENLKNPVDKSQNIIKFSRDKNG